VSTFKPQQKIRATYMRGGTSKGVFFNVADLPPEAQVPGPARDALCLRVIGSPDPYGKHTDGMGGATSSTSKVVLVSKSDRPGHDVDYLFGQVSIDSPFVDWSGNCGNLSAAVGPFAIAEGLIDAARVPAEGPCEVRIWQANIEKTLLNQVPMSGGAVQETGDFELDGVTFPAAEVPVDFLDPADGEGALFPTGQLVDRLEVPGVGTFEATMINSGIPTIFLRAAELGYTGTELQEAINNDAAALARFETIRAHGALAMGLIQDVSEAATRQHTPKVAFVAPATTYAASSGKPVDASSIDLCVRALSMGKLHHAMMGTAAVAIATAAVIPGTLVNEAAGGGERDSVTFGHPSGTLRVGAEAAAGPDGSWAVKRVRMSRSARVLMEGWVRIPSDHG
jgi:probable AcnD-accessory protein PrpF